MPRYNKNLDRGLDESDSLSFQGSKSYRENQGKQSKFAPHHYNTNSKLNRSEVFGIGGNRLNCTFEERDEDNDQDDDFFSKPKSKGFGSYGPSLTARNQNSASNFE